MCAKFSLDFRFGFMYYGTYKVENIRLFVHFACYSEKMLTFAEFLQYMCVRNLVEYRQNANEPVPQTVLLFETNDRYMSFV